MEGTKLQTWAKKAVAVVTAAALVLCMAPAVKTYADADAPSAIGGKTQGSAANSEEEQDNKNNSLNGEGGNDVPKDTDSDVGQPDVGQKPDDTSKDEVLPQVISVDLAELLSPQSQPLPSRSEADQTKYVRGVLENIELDGTDDEKIKLEVASEDIWASYVLSDAGFVATIDSSKVSIKDNAGKYVLDITGVDLNVDAPAINDTAITVLGSASTEGNTYYFANSENASVLFDGYSVSLETLSDASNFCESIDPLTSTQGSTSPTIYLKSQADGIISKTNAYTFVLDTATPVYAGYDVSSNASQKTEITLWDRVVAFFTGKSTEGSGIETTQVTFTFTDETSGFYFGSGVTVDNVNFASGNKVELAGTVSDDGKTLTAALEFPVADNVNEDLSTWKISVKDKAGNTLNVESATSVKPDGGANYDKIYSSITRPAIKVALNAKADIVDGVLYVASVAGKTLDLQVSYEYLKELQYVLGEQTIAHIKLVGDDGGVRLEQTITLKDLNENGTLLTPIALQDGDYEVTGIGVVDFFENATCASDFKFTVDTANPVISVTYDGEFTNYGGSQFRQGKTTATIKVTEHNFDASKVDIKAVTDDTADGVIFGEWQQVGNMYTRTVTFTNEGRCMLSVGVTDKAGNTATPYSGTWIQDLADPEVCVVWDNDDVASSRITGGAEADYFSAGRTATITVSERYFDESLIRIATSSLAQADGLQGEIGGVVWENSGNTHVASITFANDGIYDLSVSGKDMAGRTFDAYKAKRFVIDQTAPVSSIVWNTYDVRNGSYYNTARVASITVTDNNWDESKVSLGYSIDSSATSITTTGWQTNANKHTIQISFNGEGDCEIALGGTDFVGRAMNGISEHFTQDFTAPEVSVTWDNNDVYNAKYYIDVRTATVSVNERNFSDSLLTITPVSSALNDGTVGTYNVSGWIKEGDVYKAGVTFPTEGCYRLTCSGMDLAGNSFAEYIGDEFIIDLTDPQITIGGIEDQKAYAHAAQPTVCVTDINVSTQTSVSIEPLSLTKTNPYSATPDITDTQITYAYNNPSSDDSINDGVYRLTVSAVDSAGRSATQTAVWSVNRFGSTFVIASGTEPLIGGYNNADAMDKATVEIHEISASGVADQTVSVSRDANSQALGDDDYSIVAVSGGSESWYEYVYTVNKSVFKDAEGYIDGSYSIVLQSRDKTTDATNVANISNVERGRGYVDVRFVLDDTAPDAYVSGIYDGAAYNSASQDVVVNFSDNTKLAKAVITVDATVVAALEGDDLGVAQTVGFAIGDSPNRQIVKVTALDGAGNAMEVQTYSVLVTTNPISLWLNSTVAVALTIACAVVAIAAIGLFFARRLKRKIV